MATRSNIPMETVEELYHFTAGINRELYNTIFNKDSGVQNDKMFNRMVEHFDYFWDTLDLENKNTLVAYYLGTKKRL